MTEDPTPTTLRRQLGAQLRRLRQERGETAQQLADALGFSVSKVSRMESGARAVSEPDIAALVEYFDVSNDLAVELSETARSGRRRREAAPYVPAPETDHLAFVRSGFVELERDAVGVREFNSGLVPGLLQDVAYMRALMLSSVPDDSDTLAKAIDLRVRRQGRLGQGAEYIVIIDEAVLARVVGGPVVMMKQMGAILHRLDEGSVDLRVVPFSVGAHPGLNSVFVMLTMSMAGAVSDVVFIEGLVGHQRFERGDEVERFERVWRQLLASSFGPDESRSMVEQYQARYAASRGDGPADAT